MKILSIGSMSKPSNTCRHRHAALEEKSDKIDVINTYERPVSLWYRIAHHLFLYGLPIKLPDCSNANSQIKELIDENQYDVVWIDKGITINRATLEYIRRKNPNVKIVSFSPDNMVLRHNQSQNYLECIPLYDFIFTNKSYILEDMKKLGAKNIHFVNNSYETAFHYPRSLNNDDLHRLGGDVGFIGAWEKERCDSILYLAKNGIKVKVFGDGKWENYRSVPNLTIESAIYSEDYSKALRAFKLSLCFLRKMNFDQQTTRTMEIPACGGFMLAERTDEHSALFEEGEEAAFFSSNEELLEKCRYYLSHEDERKRIAEAGLKRCRTSGYSNEETMKKMIEIVMCDE
jgi:hypothetical protein